MNSLTIYLRLPDFMKQLKSCLVDFSFEEKRALHKIQCHMNCFLVNDKQCLLCIKSTQRLENLFRQKSFLKTKILEIFFAI